MSDFNEEMNVTLSASEEPAVSAAEKPSFKDNVKKRAAKGRAGAV